MVLTSVTIGNEVSMSGYELFECPSYW